MVKSLATALVCGAFFVVYTSAQEVFVGENKAKPKYPKAQAAADHPKLGIQDNKVASAPPKKAETPAKPASAAVVSKSENVTAEKKNSVAATVAKTTKPEAKASTTTVTKAAPAVVPGQRAPAATPSPIVKPEAPMLAKSSAHGKLPLAAVPPPSKTAQAAHAAPAAPQVTVTTAPNKSEKAGERKTQPVVAATKEPPPPAEGPTHDVVVKIKKPAVTAPTTKIASKTSTSPKPAPTEKAASAEEEEENPAAALTSSRPVVASSIVLKKNVAFPKSTFPQMRTDAHTIATAPSTLQNHRELPSATRVALTQPVIDSSTSALSSDHYETAFIKLADGFDFPVGKPDAQGYYKARGYRSHGHQGEDWDGVGGGDTDLGDPIYAIGDGLVVFARDCHMGWGNVVIIRHSYRESGTVKTIDSLYGHLLNIMVHKGQAVTRGQKIASMGTAHGLYDAHLHLEVRKNIEIGMSRAAFAQDFSNYYDPSQFIQAHRHLQSGGGSYRVAMNTFTRDARIRWDKVRNYSHPHTGGGSSESGAALKRALASKNNG